MHHTDTNAQPVPLLVDCGAVWEISDYNDRHKFAVYAGPNGISIVRDDKRPMTTDEARRLSAALVEAADNVIATRNEWEHNAVKIGLLPPPPF